MKQEGKPFKSSGCWSFSKFWRFYWISLINTLYLVNNFNFGSCNLGESRWNPEEAVPPTTITRRRGRTILYYDVIISELNTETGIKKLNFSQLFLIRLKMTRLLAIFINILLTDIAHCPLPALVADALESLILTESVLTTRHFDTIIAGHTLPTDLTGTSVGPNTVSIKAGLGI